MKVTLTRVHRKEEVSQRTGNKYTRLGIKTKEHGEKWLSGFGSKLNDNWVASDVVDIEVEKKGEYLNFRTLGKLDLLEKRVAKLEDIVLNKQEESVSAKEESEEIEASDLPF